MCRFNVNRDSGSFWDNSIRGLSAAGQLLALELDGEYGITWIWRHVSLQVVVPCHCAHQPEV